jgi:hypothetical protein
MMETKPTREEQNALPEEGQERAYVPPRLTRLGNLAEITRGLELAGEADQFGFGFDGVILS